MDVVAVVSLGSRVGMIPIKTIEPTYDTKWQLFHAKMKERNNKRNLRFEKLILLEVGWDEKSIIMQFLKNFSPYHITFI